MAVPRQPKNKYVEAASCATSWQRDVIARSARKLADDAIQDSKREFDGAIHIDMPYYPCDKYVCHLEKENKARKHGF